MREPAIWMSNLHAEKLPLFAYIRKTLYKINYTIG